MLLSRGERNVIGLRFQKVMVSCCCYLLCYSVICICLDSYVKRLRLPEEEETPLAGPGAIESLHPQRKSIPH